MKQTAIPTEKGKTALQPRPSSLFEPQVYKGVEQKGRDRKGLTGPRGAEKKERKEEGIKTNTTSRLHS